MLLALGLYVGPVWGVGVAVASLLVAAGIFASAAVTITVDATRRSGWAEPSSSTATSAPPKPWMPPRPAAARGCRPTPGRIWCSGRTCSTAVEITLADPADPVPYWLISTRRPAELAAALDRAGLHYGGRVSAAPAPSPGTPGPGWVPVLLLQLDGQLEPPAYAHPGDAGADLRSAEDFQLEPGERRLVGTGVAIALPEGYAAFVYPRSGLAARHGISIVNGPGTVDAGYRGEIKVCLINTDRVGPVSDRPRRPDRPAGHPAGQPSQLRAGRRAARLGPRDWRLRVNRRNTGQLRSATGASRS